MFKRNAIPATMFFSILLISMFALKIINPQGFHQLFVLKNGLSAFYPWQIFTYIFNDSTALFYYFFKVLIFFWLAQVLESEWGTLHFTIFVMTGILSKSIIALSINYFVPGIPFESLLNGYGSLVSPNPLMLSLMTAFGFIYPNEKIYLFFVLPVRIKLLSIISLAIVLVQTIMILSGGNSFSINLIVAVIYLSGFSSLLIYFKRIFKPSLILHTIKNQNKLKGFYKHNKNNTSNKTIDISSMPLCDEHDFDENEEYCKSCNLLTRCIDRKNNKEND